MTDGPNLEAMWAPALRNQTSIPSIEMDFVYTTVRKIPDVCGGSYKTQFLGNRHPSITLTVHVLCQAVYMGRIVNEEIKIIKVKHGVQNEVELGCTGFQNDSGGYNTTYVREPVMACPPEGCPQ